MDRPPAVIEKDLEPDSTRAGSAIITISATSAQSRGSETSIRSQSGVFGGIVVRRTPAT
jgi:hypothetical protein